MLPEELWVCAAAEVTRTVQVVNAAPPSLTIERNANGTVTVTFDGNLQTASSVNGPWKGVEGAGRVTLSTDEAQQFFRATR